jgi:biotin transport system substrate-specific component
MKLKSSARAAAASLLAVVTAILAQLSIRVGPVPYTMQNAGLILSGLLLPPGWALTSQLLYLAMIALGAPAAAGFRGGLGVLLGPTGGYLAGFPIASVLIFLPQDLLMDHVLALVVAQRVARALPSEYRILAGEK